MPRRTKEDALKTRERLLDAAEAVFLARGLASASLKDIADAAGVTRGAVYWHFRNKLDLFEAMADRQPLPLEDMNEAAAAGATADPLARLRELLLALIAEVATDSHRRRVYEIILHKVELTEANEPLSSRHRRNILAFSDSARRVFTAARDAGHLPAALDIEHAVLNLDVQMTGLMYLWPLLGDTFEFEREAVKVIDAYFDALRRNFGERC